MKLLGVFLACASLLPASYAVERQYQNGKIVNIEQKHTTRVLYWQVDTPITQDDPYYEFSVQLGDTVYMSKYTPLHASDTLPDEWSVPGATVQARLEGHHLYLRRPSGVEMDTMIAKRMAAKAQSTRIPEPAKK